MALVTGVSVAQAQTTYPNVKVTGRLQEQFYYFGNEDYASAVGAKSAYIAPGSPWENGYVESFMYGRPLRCKVNRAGRAALGSGAFMYAACSCGLVL